MLILETLLNSSINSITDLNLSNNPSWFSNPANIELLIELIFKYAAIQNLNLGDCGFVSDRTSTILTSITNDSSSSKNKKFDLSLAKLESDEAVERLANNIT